MKFTIRDFGWFVSVCALACALFQGRRDLRLAELLLLRTSPHLSSIQRGDVFWFGKANGSKFKYWEVTNVTWHEDEWIYRYDLRACFGDGNFRIHQLGLHEIDCSWKWYDGSYDGTGEGPKLFAEQTRLAQREDDLKEWHWKGRDSRFDIQDAEPYDVLTHKPHFFGFFAVAKEPPHER